MSTKTPRMTLSRHKYYSIDQVRKFLGLGPNTNPSRRNYPALIGVRYVGYRGGDIIETIRGRNGATDVSTEWWDTANFTYRAEIVFV